MNLFIAVSPVASAFNRLVLILTGGRMSVDKLICFISKKGYTKTEVTILFRELLYLL